MKTAVGFFNVDTQQPAENRGKLVFRPRVEPFAALLKRLLDFAEANDILVVHTACVNAGLVEEAVSRDALFVRADDVESRWSAGLEHCRAVYLQKLSCGGPEENVKNRAFDVFHANPNASRLLERLDIRHWVVFGDSVRFCLQSTARGLLALGYEVTAPSDAVGPGVDTEAVKAEVLQGLARDGVRLETVAEFLSRQG